MTRTISRWVIANVVILGLTFAALAMTSSAVGAAEPSPSTAETARLLGYMWGDGTRVGDVWDVNGPSGTSNLIEELVEAHGGEWVDRQKLQFTLPAQFDWAEWKDGLPDDSADVRDAVRNQHFLAAVMETEASVVGQIYDQSRCCVPGYTRGRLTELRDLLRERGFSTAQFVQFNNVDSGRVTVDSSEWRELRGVHRFVCPVADSDIRIPGGSDHDDYGNLRWFNANTRWASLVRTDCVDGRSIPDVEPLAGSCSVSVEDTDRVRVSWTFELGEASIRRDNAFVTSVSGRDGSYTERPGDGSFTYEVRLQAFGVQTSASCGSVTIGDGAVDGPCVVSTVGGAVRVSWDDFGKARYSVRRNGSWVSTVTDGSTSITIDTGAIDDTWTIRYRDGGATITVPCAAGGVQPPPDGPCVVVPAADGAQISWDDVAGVDTYQVRRNGNWLARVDNQTSYVHAGGAVGDTYVVRYRLDGGITDIDCIA